MKLKDVLKTTFQKTRIRIIVTHYPIKKDQEYINLNNPMFPDELIKLDGVKELLDNTVQFFGVVLYEDFDSNCYLPTLDVYVYGD